MVRCGVVSHPEHWEWLGLHEIMGGRHRYRLLDLDQLCWRVRADSLEDLRMNLRVSLGEAIAKDELKREAYWTESIAVGSAGFLEKVQPLMVSRQETEIEETVENLWTLSEAPIPYGRKTGPKNACKAVN